MKLLFNINQLAIIEEQRKLEPMKEEIINVSTN